MNPLAALPSFPDRNQRATIWQIALPIMGGMASQNLLNLVDIAMVGRLGDSALAATGLGSFANFMLTAPVLGLATGVQAITARRLGEGQRGMLAAPLDGGLLLAWLLGLPLMALVWLIAPWLMHWLTSDAHVQPEAANYLQIRALAIAFVGMNFAFRGYWSAMRQTRFYLTTLLCMHSLNILLNWLLIFGHWGFPALGVEGAAWATTIALGTGSAIHGALAWRHARPEGFLRHVPNRATLANMMRIALPSSIQQFFFATGMLALFWIVGQIGTPEVAAMNVLMNLTLVALLPSMGLGIAAASLVGHALGADDADEAWRWGWRVAWISSSVALAAGGLLLLLPQPVLSLFLHQADTLELARWPLQIMAAIVWFDAVGMTLMHSLLGAGDSRRVMRVSLISQWLLFLPLAWLAGPGAGGGLLAVWLVQGGYRILQAAWFVRHWQRGQWRSIRV